METIKLNDSGAAVEDVQHRLSRIGLLDEACIDGLFGPETAKAVASFRSQAQLECGDEVDEKTWAALVDASFCLGDRTLYLRMASPVATSTAFSARSPSLPCASSRRTWACPPTA